MSILWPPTKQRPQQPKQLNFQSKLNLRHRSRKHQRLSSLQQNLQENRVCKNYSSQETCSFQGSCRETPVARTPRRASTSAKKPVAEAIQELPAPKHISLEDPALYTNRELSWIEFDRKVLETAMDPAIPLLNRVLFLSIFFNNLDEFYMVRVMNLQKQARSGAEPTGPDKLSPAKQLSEIRRKVLEIVDQAEDLWLDQLKPALAKKILLLRSMQI